jgi:phosphoglycerate kinase
VLKKVTDLPVDGRRVFIRVDFNVPLEDGAIADDTRIRAALPTIKHCLERDARVVLASHLGRPKGVVVPELSLEPIATHLSELLDLEILLTDEPAGDGARKVVSDLRQGHVAVLENLRFDPGETANEENFARALASYADVYVNDAFGTAHRAHASTAGMVPYVSERGGGFLMAREVEQLSKLLGEVERPYVAIIGGAMANTFLAARGSDMGASRLEEDKLPLARNFLRKAIERGVDIDLPSDVVVAESLDAATGTVAGAKALGATQMALDIGPETTGTYVDAVTHARTIFWNGPMGVFEREPFASGTRSLAGAVAANRLAFSVVGGGDSVAAIAEAGLTDRISHVSTGGGASLEFVQGVTLPGIRALET